MKWQIILVFISIMAIALIFAGVDVGFIVICFFNNRFFITNGFLACPLIFSFNSAAVRNRYSKQPDHHSYKEAVKVVMSIALEAYNENDGKDINGCIRRKLYGNPV